MHRDGGTSLPMLPFSLFGRGELGNFTMFFSDLFWIFPRQRLSPAAEPAVAYIGHNTSVQKCPALDCMPVPFLRGIFPKGGRERKRERERGRERVRETAGRRRGIAVNAGHVLNHWYYTPWHQKLHIHLVLFSWAKLVIYVPVDWEKARRNKISAWKKFFKSAFLTLQRLVKCFSTLIFDMSAIGRHRGGRLHECQKSVLKITRPTLEK